MNINNDRQNLYLFIIDDDDASASSTVTVLPGQVSSYDTVRGRARVST